MMPVRVMLDGEADRCDAEAREPARTGRGEPEGEPAHLAELRIAIRRPEGDVGAAHEVELAVAEVDPDAVDARMVADGDHVARVRVARLRDGDKGQRGRERGGGDERMTERHEGRHPEDSGEGSVDAGLTARPVPPVSRPCRSGHPDSTVRPTEGFER
jgi:hypothetical protein